MAGLEAIRASDADRERVASRLRDAAAEGRLLTDELEQRLEATFAARTYGELDAVLADLPGRRLARPRQRQRSGGLVVPALAIISVPLALAVVAAVVFLVTGVLAGWMLWLLVGWWFFGPHRRGYGGARHVHGMRACGPWHRPRGRPPGFWV
jgi:hypothetical protein